MLELAARLRGLPREQLAAALQTREFDPVGIRDLFDLAEALLSSDSVDQAISRLDRPRLAVLAAAAGIVGADAGTTVDEVRAELVRLGASAELSDASGDLLEALSKNLLVVEAGDRVHVPSAVASRLTSRSGHEIPSAAELAAPAPPVLVAFDEVDRSILERRAAETAYATVAATAELIAELGTQPARELAKGGLALPDSKRLAEASGTELDALPRLFHRADEAGLVVRDGAFWLESDLGAAWALETAAGRWRRLAECWRDRIPPALRELVARRSETLSASTFRDDVNWFYPAGGR